MTKDEAVKVLNQIEAVCVKNGLWYTVETEKRPELRSIKVKEISIKIDAS
jgi:hypothetical protein